MTALTKLTKCVGCGAELKHVDGPTHAYMASSAACFAAFNTLLSFEYGCRDLKKINRLTVDTFAVQHPGENQSRQEIQSVGLHLARLGVQMDGLMPPAQTNAVMLDLGQFKSSLIYLAPPKKFSITVSDIAPFAGTEVHAAKVQEWAAATWDDWRDHHTYTREWTATKYTRGT